MLCITLQEFVRACAPVSGGISDIVTFDPDDFDFTQAPPVAGVAQPYSAIALRAGATGDLMYKNTFVTDEAEWAWAQSRKGCSVKYEHTFTFQLPENSQALTTWLQALDAAACCCGLGMIIRTTNGKIFVAGEKWVNAASIPKFTVLNEGSTGTTGKLYDDFNGGTIVLKGNFSRSLYEYSGTWASIEAFMA